MKKIMFAAAVAAAGLAFGIESANTVGFHTKSVQAGKFAIFGPQFEDMAGNTDINKLITGVTGVSQDSLGDDFVKYAPHIQVPNAAGTGYAMYYYLTDGYYDTGTVDGEGDPVYAQKPGWCDQNGLIAGEEGADADGVLPPGVAIWIKDVNLSESFQQAGQVSDAAYVDQTVPATFVLRTHGYPVAFDLNDSTKVTFTGLAGVSQDSLGDDFVKSAPHIQVPNAAGTGYAMYYYLTDGYYDTGTVDGEGDPVYAQKPGWCDQNGLIAGEEGADADGIVPVGTGFWAKGVGSSFSVRFLK